MKFCPISKFMSGIAGNDIFIYTKIKEARITNLLLLDFCLCRKLFLLNCLFYFSYLEIDAKRIFSSVFNQPELA